MYKEIDEVSPKVSIIVPMYNCELYIERCMESLLKQTYSNIEIIVVDDGSKDSCAKIVKMINEINSKVRYLFQNNSGPGTARNRAIKESTGKYILFVDSDDYLANDYVEELVASAERYNSDLVVAGYTLVYENSNKSLPVIPMKYEKGISEEWAYRISACCSRLYSKEFWDKQNLEFSEEKDARAEDVPIALYSNVMARNISVVYNPGYYYYQHAKSAMNNRNNKVLFKFPYEAFKEMYEKVQLMEKENSESFFQIGVLKFLAQFDLVIYRKANQEEKEKFKMYLKEVIGKEFYNMIQSWKSLKYKINLPITHKIAIDFFIIKYKRKL